MSLVEKGGNVSQRRTNGADELFLRLPLVEAISWRDDICRQYRAVHVRLLGALQQKLSPAVEYHDAKSLTLERTYGGNYRRNYRRYMEDAGT